MSPNFRRCPAIVIAVVLALAALPARADFNNWISPGIKLGYTFGERGGFTYGAEVSLLRFPGGDRISVGGVLSLDMNLSGLTKLHLGAQVSAFEPPLLGGGLELGPSLIFDRERLILGAGFTPWFSAAFAIPSYTLTVAPDMEALHEAGLLLKMPFLLNAFPAPWSAMGCGARLGGSPWPSACSM